MDIHDIAFYLAVLVGVAAFCWQVVVPWIKDGRRK